MRQKIGFMFQDIGVFFAYREWWTIASFFARCEAVVNPANVEKEKG